VRKKCGERVSVIWAWYVKECCKGLRQASGATPSPVRLVVMPCRVAHEQGRAPSHAGIDARVGALVRDLPFCQRLPRAGSEDRTDLALGDAALVLEEDDIAVVVDVLAVLVRLEERDEPVVVVEDVVLAQQRLERLGLLAHRASVE
jgi:hypothetical protein